VRYYRQSKRKGLYPLLERKLYEHIVKKRAVGATISRRYIQFKARRIALRQKIEKFVGSYECYHFLVFFFTCVDINYFLKSTNGWLVNFLLRHNLTLRRITTSGRALPRDSHKVVNKHLEKIDYPCEYYIFKFVIYSKILIINLSSLIYVRKKRLSERPSNNQWRRTSKNFYGFFGNG